MLALLVFVAIHAYTFVGCNGKIDGNLKSGFFISFSVILILVGLIGLVLG